MSYCYLIGTCHDGSRSISGSTAWDSYDYTENMLGYADSIADTVTKFILRFVERVCLEANINTDHVKSLQSLVPGKKATFSGWFFQTSLGTCICNYQKTGM